MNCKQNFNNKYCFVGISLTPSSTTETGIAVLDRNLNLLRVDKVYNLNDLELYIKNLAPADSIMVCVDLPKNITAASGKWRQESKNVNIFRFNKTEVNKFEWAERFSDRGHDFCNVLNSMDIDTYRYYCYFTKNQLKLIPPFKSRSPVACKALQMNIENYLNIQGIPSNLIAISGLDAIIGAYTAWKMAHSQENKGYRNIGSHKNIPIISAV